MGTYIAKLADDVYIEWSTVVDAPISYTATREQAVQAWGGERVRRADENGTSILDGYPAGRTPEEIVRSNRAGPGESEISVAEIIKAYDNANPAPWTLPACRDVQKAVPERAAASALGKPRPPSAPHRPPER